MATIILSQYVNRNGHSCQFTLKKQKGWPEKTAYILRRHQGGFPRNDVCELNDRRNFILMTCHYRDLGRSSDWSCSEGNFSSANQMHSPDLGSDTSSVWNFCARWWRRKMSAVF